MVVKTRGVEVGYDEWNSHIMKEGNVRSAASSEYCCYEEDR